MKGRQDVEDLKMGSVGSISREVWQNKEAGEGVEL